MKKYTLAFAFLALLGACKKDDNKTATTSGASALTSGYWKLSSSTSLVEFPAPVGPQNTDLFAMLPECEKDNVFTFNANNTTTIDEGATKCSPGDPQTETVGNWQLTNNDTRLFFTHQGIDIDAEILTLNSSALTLKYITTINGINATTTSSYSRP